MFAGDFGGRIVVVGCFLANQHYIFGEIWEKNSGGRAFLGKSTLFFIGDLGEE